MLIDASLAINELRNLFAAHVGTERFRFLTDRLQFIPELSPYKIQRASIAGDAIVGYLECYIDTADVARNLIAASFKPSSITFARDAIAYTNLLFRNYCVRKIVVEIATNNSLADTFRKFFKKNGTRYVGTLLKDRKYRGVISDVEIYEITPENIK
jgi:hypothetical protein